MLASFLPFLFSTGKQITDLKKRTDFEIAVKM